MSTIRRDATEAWESGQGFYALTLDVYLGINGPSAILSTETSEAGLGVYRSVAAEQGLSIVTEIGWTLKTHSAQTASRGGLTAITHNMLFIRTDVSARG